MGPMRLNDVVAAIVGDVINGKPVNKRQAAVERWDDIDADGQYIAGIDGLVARINDRARSLRVRAGEKSAGAQPQLPFQLPAAVSMDLEEAALLATRTLTRAQFVRAIEIRRQQIANDSQALREWRSALRQADRIWSLHPDWTFGQCLDAILDASMPNAA